ncbi:MAG: sulfatase-like hydrolase/transferase [Planctomycetota bacterium]|nr:sulfatase-like hydrolase/transferase [Planctomycetota bacterium]
MSAPQKKTGKDPVGIFRRERLARWGLSLFLVTLNLVWSAGPVVAGPPDARPNILLVNLDDADRELFRPEVLEKRFPNLHSIARSGITFSNFHVTTPLCGPSRACLLRGQYAHALGHRTNDAAMNPARGFSGDFSSFVEKGYLQNEIGWWMKQAGYHTVFVGKYINHSGSGNTVPRGWDDFYRSQGSRYYRTFRFTNRHQAKGSHEKVAEGVYRTTQEADDIVRIVHQQKDNASPMFIYFAPFGPHSEGKAEGGMIDRQDEDLWQDIQQFKNEDYDESDVSDKPAEYRRLPRLTPELKRKIQTDFRNRMLATKSVDRAVGRILNCLELSGRLANTLVFITSDNGYSLGQHRISGKGNTMTRSSHVPLLVSGPGVRPCRANHLLAHIDLAPTFLELAGGRQQDFFDGKSFARLIRDPGSCQPESWRESILIENWQMRKFMQFALRTTFCQLRLYDEVYTEWADGSREFYDLSRDPLELRNRYTDLEPDRVSQLSNQLKGCRRMMPEPIATVERPPATQVPLAGPPFVIRGVAEDSSGVEKVDLVIRKWSSGDYWNGKSWQQERLVLETALKNRGGIQSEWNYSFSPTAGELSSARYNVVPRAYASNGKFTRSVNVEPFHFDTCPPSTFIQKIHVPVSGQVRATGRTRDNHRVREVRIQLFNSDTGEFFDGSGWAARKNHVCRETDANDRWEFQTPPLASGNYVIRARAYDVAGNWDPTQEVRRFRIE